MKKLFYLLLLSIFLFGIVSAGIPNLEPVKQGNCINLVQSCATCSYNNLTSVIAPNNSSYLLSGEYVMTKSGNNYNYTFCGNSDLGVHVVNGHGDLNGLDKGWVYTYEVTPSGKSDLLGLYILLIIGIYAIAFIGWFGKSEWVTIFGGLGMVALGLYTINNGIIIYRDFITNIFSWTTIGLGAFFALYSAVSIVQDNLT